MRIENIVRGRKLTQTDQAIVAFIAQNTEQVLQMSVRDLAEASFTSPAAVVRFCKRIDVGSFGELKVRLARAVGEGDDIADADFPKLAQAGGAQVTRTIADMERTALAETEKLLLGVDFSPIVDALEASCGVSVYGLGYSQHAAASFCSNLRRLGHHVTFEKDESRMGAWAMACPKEEFHVLVSYSGETAVASIARLLKGRGATTVSVTADTPNTLAGITTWNIPVALTERRFLNNRMAPFCSVAETSLALDVLYAQLFSRHYLENVRLLTNSLVGQGATPQRNAAGDVVGLNLPSQFYERQ